MNSKAPAKPKKVKGPIRFEAVIPVTIIIVVVWAYFHFFFDANLRSGLEFVGYQVVGAEVDIAKLETSFWNASLRVQGVELTDAQKPEKNMVEIGDIRLGVHWDGLLRARLVVDEMAVEGIKIGTTRKMKGKVKPPEPPKPKATGPSAVEKEATKVGKIALDKTAKDNQSNVLGDIAAILQGGSSQDQLGKIEGTLASKAKLAELEKNFNEKSKAWDQRLKTLPQQKDIQSLSDRMNKIKTKDFKTPQEVADSVNQFQAIMKEADEKYKAVQSTANDLQNDFKVMDQDLKSLDGLVKKDMADLESRFRIPKLDAAEISKSIFRQYLNSYLARFEQYRVMAEKYIPPKTLQKGTKEPDPQIQPHPRAKGVSYEFGRQNSYPMFWIKKIAISSQAGASAAAGTIKGTVTDVTSNQVLVGRPTVATINGDFPSDEIKDLLVRLTLDNTKAESNIVFDFNVGSYPVNGREVVTSPDVNLAFQKATGKIVSKGTLNDLTNLKMTFSNVVQNVTYDVKAQNSTVQDILTGIFKGIPNVNVDATIEGEVPEFKIDVSSNLGPEIQKGFDVQIKKKIEEAKQKIQNYVNEQVGKEKAKFEAEVSKYKAQIDGEVKKVQAQIDGQKKQAEAKADESKKRSEDQAKQQMQQQGQKAVDDLKKKFGL